MSDDKKYEALVTSHHNDGGSEGTLVTEHSSVEEAVDAAYEEKERLEDMNYKVTRISVEEIE